jgi:hypothetical protein
LYSAGEPFGVRRQVLLGTGEPRAVAKLGAIAIVAYDSGAGMTEIRSLNLSQVNS